MKKGTDPVEAKLWLVITLQPVHGGLELGCFHGDRVFDRQVWVRWSAHCERVHLCDVIHMSAEGPK